MAAPAAHDRRGNQDPGSTIYAFGFFNPAYTGLGNVLGGADMDWLSGNRSRGCTVTPTAAKPFPE